MQSNGASILDPYCPIKSFFYIASFQHNLMNFDYP